MTTYNHNLNQYNANLFAVQDEILQFVWENTPKKGLPPISVRPEEGRFLQILARMCGASQALEIGTLGGYSAIWIARGLLPGGHLITIEKDAYHAEIARRHLEAAGLQSSVEVRVGEAVEILPELSAGQPFDFVFIDADKPNYERYYDWAIEHVRIGGVIAAHNAFRGGAVLQSNPIDEATRKVQALNRRVAADSRVLSTIYPAGDGTLVALKVCD
jgi:predicted O-methyltransferase YrrM